MTAGTLEPHGRWLLLDRMAQLAASHADVRTAVAALDVAAARHRDRTGGGPPFWRRLAARRGWPRTAGLVVAMTATAFFLIWISTRLVGHMAMLPAFVAALPGVLLTTAFASAASYAAHSLTRPARLLPPSVPLAAASVGVIAWITLWLVLTGSTPAWSAVIFAMALTVSAGVALVTCSFPGSPSATSPPPASRRQPSRSVRVRQRRARKRLDAHTRQWMEAAHRYAVTIAGTSRLEGALACLVAGEDRQPALDGVDPYDVMMLSALRKYHPAALGADLDSAAKRYAGTTGSALDLPAALAGGF